jgi:hypothetical protein
LYRANSARYRQIDEFAEALFKCKPADRWINSQFYPMILKTYLSTSNTTMVNQFTISLFSLFCLDFVKGQFRPISSNWQICRGLFYIKTSWQVDTFTSLHNDLGDVSLRQIYGEPVHHLPFSSVLSWLCIGPIPQGIVKLTNLITLWLNNNQLTGQLIYVFTQWSLRRISTSKKTMVNQFTISLFLLFCLDFV